MSVLELQGKQDFHSPLTWKLGRSANLEVCCISVLLTSNRGWQVHRNLLSLLTEGGSLSQHHANFLSQAPGKVLLRVPFLRAVIPEPGLLRSVSRTKVKVQLRAHILCLPFALQGRSSEPGSLWKFLGSDGNTPRLLNCIPNLGAPGRQILPSGPSSGSYWQEHEHPPNCSFTPSHRASLFLPICRLEGRGAKHFPSGILGLLR